MGNGYGSGASGDRRWGSQSQSPGMMEGAIGWFDRGRALAVAKNPSCDWAGSV